MSSIFAEKISDFLLFIQIDQLIEIYPHFCMNFSQIGFGILK